MTGMNGLRQEIGYVIIKKTKGTGSMNEILSQLLDAARSDASLKKTLLASETAADPMAEFCRAASEAGFPVTVGELFAMGQEYTDNLLKSVNGGAEYPMEGWEDTYELFLAALKIS